jgi:hypothetical protein
MRFVQYGQLGNRAQAPFRYALQAMRTWRIRNQENPSVLVVQNPPIFLALVASCYARLRGAHFAIDSHTGAFLSPKWRWSLGLHRALSRSALTTIVHNKSQESIVKAWQCPYCVVGFIPGEYPAGQPFPFDERFSVAFIGGPVGDEPLDLVFAAARCLPDVCFYVTSGSKSIPANLLAVKPENCRLTGYLPYAQYVGLLQGANVILAMTARDNTLLMGGFEAVSLGSPLIVSDWPILRDYFHLGVVHIPNTVAGICDGVLRARRDEARLRREITCLGQQLQAQWEQEFAVLRHSLLAGRKMADGSTPRKAAVAP